MAVTVRGYKQGWVESDASGSVTWASLTGGAAQAGDLGLVICRDASTLGPSPSSGWVQHGRWLWVKVLTAADVAGSTTLRGRTLFAAALAGAEGVGRRADQPGVRVSTAGGALFVQGWSEDYHGDMKPDAATYRLGAEFYDHYGDTDGIYLVGAASAGWTELPGANSRTCDYYSYEIKPTAGPAAPVLVSPTGGVDTDWSQPTVLAFTSPSGVPEAVRVQVRVAAGTWYYVQSDGTLTTTPTDLSQSETVVEIDAEALTANTGHEWKADVTRQGIRSLESTLGTFTPRTPPSVDSITVTSPAEDLTPSIASTATAGYGSIVATRYAVTPAAAVAVDEVTALYISPVLSGHATPHVVAPQEWTNGASVRAWVWVTQTGGLDSGWVADDTTFAVSWTPPDAPTSVTAANPTGGPLQVTVAGVDGDAVGLAVYWRPDDAEAAWTLLRTVTDPTATTVVDVPLAPYGIAMQYRAYVWSEVDGVALPSAVTTIAAAVASTDPGEYLVADDGVDYLAVRIVTDGYRRALQGVAVRVPLTADDEPTVLVDRTPVAGHTGSTVLETMDEAEWDAVHAWVTGRSAWWWRWGPERKGSTRVDATPTRACQAAAPGWGRRIQFAETPRHYTVDWVTV